MIATRIEFSYDGSINHDREADMSTAMVCDNCGQEVVFDSGMSGWVHKGRGESKEPWACNPRDANDPRFARPVTEAHYNRRPARPDEIKRLEEKFNAHH